ncbi:Eco57I restriction-modification methylase domain-containing protein [Haloferax sp. DFSO52]|uniref:Eco57I restriction-modification methylase domain-containing protein n=1 Tax=Haloferax sp. DFSO52 TaxID=3388505 RepID=UPI003A87A92A
MTDEQAATIARALDDELSTGAFDSTSKSTVDAATEFFQRLFVEFLDFEPTTSPTDDTSWQTLSTREWLQTSDTTTARLIARADPFRVVYVELESLTRSAERRVVRNLTRDESTKEWATAGTVLIVFHAPDETVWHLVTPYDEHTADFTTGRLVLRRFTVGMKTTHGPVANALASIGADEPRLAERIHEAFSVESLVQAFHEEYTQMSDAIQAELRDHDVTSEDGHRYAHLLLTRLLSLYFLQQNGWFGERTDFVDWFLDRYQTNGETESFHETWLSALFFEGLARPEGAAIDTDLPTDVATALSGLPPIDTGLFDPTDSAERGIVLSDSVLTRAIRTFSERYTYTATEASPFDIDVAIDPGMLGTIYETYLAERERGEAGIFYTPRTEVDLMCRLALYEQFLRRLDMPEESCTHPLAELVFGDSHEWDHSNDFDRDELSSVLRDLRVVDPACGSGAFLVGMNQVMSELSEKLGYPLGRDRTRRRVDQNLYGVDIKPLAVDVAAFRLWLLLVEEDSHRPPTTPHVPDVSFNLRAGDSLVETLSRTPDPPQPTQQSEVSDDSTGFQWSTDFGEVMEGGGFDIVITNPPYVHHQDIVQHHLHDERLDQLSQPDRQWLKTAYKDELLSYVRERFDIDLYRRSDLYVYFFFKAIDVLRDGGTLAFITSNTWLDNSYGKRLQQGLLELTDLSFVVDNRERRSFANADINTVITIANKTPERMLRGDVGFVALGAPFDQVNTLSNMRVLVTNTNAEMTDAETTDSGTTSTTFTMATERGRMRRFDETRVVSLDEEALWRLGGGTTASIPHSHTESETLTPGSVATGTYTGNTWGQFLRAPPTYFELLEAGSDVFVPLSEIATVGSYLNTGGADDFFFVDVVDGDPQTEPFVTIRNRVTGDTFTVESAFVLPFVESPRQVSRIDLSKASYDTYVLCIPAETDLTDTAVGSYVEWGEGTDRQYHRTSGRSKVSKWWVLGHRGETSTKVVWPNRQNARHFVGYNPTQTVTSRFYRLEPRDDVTLSAEELAALLNFTPTALFTEVLASAGLGQGVLDVTGTTLRRVPVVNPDALSTESRATILDAFRTMSEREMGTMYDELGAETAVDVTLNAVSADRRQLDSTLFEEYLGLNRDVQRAVYAAILRTITDRLNKSQNV